MGLEAIIGGIVAILAAVVPAVVLYLKRQRSKRDALATVEANELDAALDRLDAPHKLHQLP